MASTPVVTKAELEEAINDIWQTAQDSDGGRGSMQDALDEIQEKCVEVCPEIEDQDDELEDEDE